MNEALIATLAVAVWIWIDALRARETALRACRRACERFGVQLLDETVALRRLLLARDGDGRMRLRRHYSFEYSEHGDERRQGEAVLLGKRVESVRGDWIEGRRSTPADETHQPTQPRALPPMHGATNSAQRQNEPTDNVIRLSDVRARATRPPDRRGLH